MYDWNHLRSFLELARGGSAAAAAKALRINQSTVQRHVAALERELGRALIERTAQGYQLTAHGERLRQSAEAVENAAYGFQRQAELLDGAPAGHVRVTSLVTIGERMIRAGFLDRFQATYPGITVEMTMGQRVLDLSRGEADVAIRGGGPGGDEALVGRRIADFPWAIYASRAFVERHGRPNSPAQIPRFSIVELTDELERLPAVRWMKSHSQGAPIAARCGNVPSVQLAVSSGAGIAPLPAVYAAEHSDLVCVFEPIPEFYYPMYLFTHRALRGVPRIKLFYDFCVRELKPVLFTGAMRAAAVGKESSARAGLRPPSENPVHPA
jgi:DNA-binding transcriptional LysR family regulator